MKRLALFAVAMLMVAGDPPVNRTELVKIQTVYLLPMANGMDQYLANWLTSLGVYRVTTDPAKADAFFTDRVGADFEARITELLPAPKKETPQKEKPKQEKPESDADLFAASAAPVEPPAARSFGGGRGNIYLVARESRMVLWSTFGRPKDTRPKHMDSLAEKVILRLKRAMAPPAKQ